MPTQACLRVRQPGPLATIQDRGRQGYQRFGMTPAGAMDAVGLAVANLLVGNSRDEAAIEFTLSGGEYELVGGPARVAVGDAAFPLLIDGRPAVRLRSHSLLPGQILRIGAAETRARGYLAIAGGLAIPAVLGSRSTHIRSRIGGLDGRPLRPGDLLPLVRDNLPAGPDRALDPRLLPRWQGPARVVLGPQADYFSAAGIDIFLSSAYEVTPQADRMGYRLAGPAIAHAGDYDIISDGIGIGCIQVPGNGQPIILLADRQSTGGYPKIACVISADLPLLAQLRPGDQVRFREVSMTDAQAAARALAAAVAELVRGLHPVGRDWDASSERLLSVNLIDGVVRGMS